MFSRSWMTIQSKVAILSSKAQAGPVLQTKAKRMERQTATNVRIVIFDRGSEYSGLKEWMHAEGIETQVVSPYTPQANGRIV
jgi:hypothetical protein